MWFKSSDDIEELYQFLQINKENWPFLQKTVLKSSLTQKLLIDFVRHPADAYTY